MSTPVVLITGALTGIGRATAIAFAKEGARLVISGRNEAAVARFGRLDVAVNNAGTEGKLGPLTDVSVECYGAMFDTDVLGVVLSLKHELRVTQAHSRGSIVNISSTMGEPGAANLALYTASKHAVEGLTKSAALESAAYGVRDNAVAPGTIETAMLDRLSGSAEKKARFFAAVPLKRGATPVEIADAVVFAASGKAAYITGQVIRVNGGKTAS